VSVRSAVADIYMDGRTFDATRAQAVFDEQGAVVFKGVLEPSVVSGYVDALRALALARLNALGLTPQDAHDLDACGRQLLGAGAGHLGELFHIAREIRQQYELLFATGMTRAISAVMPAAVVQVVPESCGVRMDAPNEDERGFHWHYDYAYISTSLDGVTGWVPLLPMSADMGWLKVVLGSHKRVHPISVRGSAASKGPFLGHHIFSLHRPDIETFERDGVELPDVGPGDVLALHCCLLHRSGLNRAARSRWTALCRFGNATDPAVVDRGWRSVRSSDGERLFNALHPELVHYEGGELGNLADRSSKV
jgi:ectoine hydroxylase-related dioxygenase (phytanoyl-CoA dioxygenase family)